MGGYWELWQKEEGRIWREIFSQVDSAIGQFVNEQKDKGIEVQVIPSRWDAPDRMLVFVSAQGGGIWNNIHLLLVGTLGAYALRVTCSAWRDIQEKEPPSPRTRDWCHSTLDQEKAWAISIPSEFEKLKNLGPNVYQKLWDVYKEVGSWRLEESGWQGYGLVAEKAVQIP